MIYGFIAVVFGVAVGALALMKNYQDDAAKIAALLHVFCLFFGWLYVLVSMVPELEIGAYSSIVSFALYGFGALLLTGLSMLTVNMAFHKPIKS